MLIVVGLSWEFLTESKNILISLLMLWSKVPQRKRGYNTGVYFKRIASYIRSGT